MINKIKAKLYERKYFKTHGIIKSYKNIEGWLTEKEAYGLYNISNKQKKGSIIVEIGSWKGKSTYCIAKGLKSGKIYAIDPFNAAGEEGSKKIYEQSKGHTPLLDQFKSTMKSLNVLHKIKPLVGYSQQFIDNFTQIDFLFIDGDHSIEGCDFDFTNYETKVKQGGFVAFHDYDKNRVDLGPTWVINNKVLKNNAYRFYKKYDSLWIAQKIK